MNVAIVTLRIRGDAHPWPESIHHWLAYRESRRTRLVHPEWRPTRLSENLRPAVQWVSHLLIVD